MIYLIRHGQTNWNVEHRTQGHTDIPLNDTGRAQALDLAHRIRYLKIDKIIASDLSRATETADIINQFFGVPMIMDDRLREFNYGDLEGTLGLTHPPEIWDIFNNAPEKLNAEPMSDVFARVKSFFDELDEVENIVLVLHGGPMRMIMHYAENRAAFDKEKYATTYQHIKIDNTAIFAWDKKSGVTLWEDV